MKKINWKSVLFLITFFAVMTAFILDGPCGGIDRWSVKTLTDTGAVHVDFKPIQSSISTLIKLYPGKKIGNSTPRFGIEYKTYTIICTIREYRTEADGDKHLVLVNANDSTQTMIGEIPNLMCDTIHKNSFRPMYDSCLVEFKKYTMKNYKVRQGKYQITGVAFFDRIHGQIGVAPNGIELHPILSFKKIK